MLKVVTWNVNSLKARLDRLLAFLEKEKPDAVCLQELKGVEEIFPREALANVGYQAAVLGQKTYNGVALLAREMPTDIVRGFGDGGEDAARFIEGTVHGVRIASVYCPNGQAVGTDKYAYKLDWYKRLEKNLRSRHQANSPLLLCGDFNVAPEDRDVHDPEAWRGQVLVTDAERSALKAIEKIGMQDTLRKHHEQAGLYSWWDYRMLGFQKNRGMRIDFILATAPLWEKCTGARIARDERKGTGASDHAPVIAEFAL